MNDDETDRSARRQGPRDHRLPGLRRPCGDRLANRARQHRRPDRAPGRSLHPSAHLLHAQPTISGPASQPTATAGRCDRLGGCSFASSPSRSRAPPTTTCSGSPGRPRISASTRSSAPTTTWRWAPTACPVPPTPGSPWPAWRERPRASASAPSSARATFRYPARSRSASPRSMQMSGGRVELGIGAGWYADGARGLRDPVPRRPRAVRPPRRDARDRHRACGPPPPGELVRLRRRALHRRRFTWAAEAGQSPAPADDHRRNGQASHSGAWRPGSPPSSTSRSASVGDSATQFEHVRAACRDAGRDPESH